MGMYDALKDGVSLLQASDNMDLMKTFMEIQSGYFEIMQELEEKKKYIIELEARVEYKEKLNFNKQGYYSGEDRGIKYCSRCYDVERILVALHPVDDGECGVYYNCPNCKTGIYIEYGET